MGADPTADKPRVPRRVRERVAANFVEARQRAELTQEELAERSDVDPLEVERIERGLTMPYLDTMLSIARALETPPADLCEGMVWDPERRRFE